MLIAPAAFELLWPVHITATAITISTVMMMMMMMMMAISELMMVRGIVMTLPGNIWRREREDNHTFVHNNNSDHHEGFNNRIVDMALFPTISTAIIKSRVERVSDQQLPFDLTLLQRF